MKVNMFNLLVTTLQSNPQVVKKFKRTFEKDKDRYSSFLKECHLDPESPTDQLSAIIMNKSEKELLDIFGEQYPTIKNNVKKKIRFQNTIKGKGLRPQEVLRLFVLYKFFELLMGSWQEPDDYENKIMALIYHNENKTKLQNFKQSFELKALMNADKRNFISGFCGSSELYAFVHGLLLQSGLSIDTVEKVKLTERDCKDISYGIAELFEVNKDYVPSEHLEGRLSITETDLMDNYEHAFFTILIGTVIKVFTKLYQQKEEELKNVKPVEKVVVKEVDNQSQKLAEKQKALNKLQVEYDRQQRKLETVTKHLKDITEYVNFLEQAREFEEKQQEEQPDAKPIIPWGDGVILFGGHPNYQANFAEKYPWVRIIKPDLTKLDRNMIKNAKTILINWKHLPHSQFYTLISVIREYNKEYQYVW